MLVLIYPNSDNNSKRYKVISYYLPKGIVKNYNVIINGKNLYDQPIDSDIKRYKEIRKLRSRLYYKKFLRNIPKKMLLPLESIVTTIFIQLINPVFH